MGKKGCIRGGNSARMDANAERPAELPFRESAFANKAKSVIFLLPNDEGADRRKPARGDRGPGDCPPAQPDSAARRSARHHGAEWLRQEHACKGARRSS